MVKITGNWGRIRTWINKRIRIQDTGNLFVGEDSGKVTTGDRNNFIGYRAGYSNTTGYRNNFIGYQAGYTNTTGNYNNFMGYRSGHLNTIGVDNCFMGTYAGYTNNIGNNNNFIGYQAGYGNTTGSNNCFVGMNAGYTNLTGNSSVCIGYNAGFYETNNNRLFIDNTARIDAANGRIKALIYGIFDPATANQLVRLNAKLELTTIKNGSTQANAGAAANEVWKTTGHATLPDNVLMIGV